MIKKSDLTGSHFRRVVLFALAVIVVVIVRMNLVFLSYHSVRRLIPRGLTKVPPVTMCVRIANAVDRAARHIPGATCLTQAFAVQWILAARGFASEIRIGVAQEDGVLKAHAWLESNGYVVIGGQIEDLSEFKSLTSIAVPEI